MAVLAQGAITKLVRCAFIANFVLQLVAFLAKAAGSVLWVIGVLAIATAGLAIFTCVLVFNLVGADGTSEWDTAAHIVQHVTDVTGLATSG